jgi:hypothetical protein
MDAVAFARRTRVLAAALLVRWVCMWPMSGGNEEGKERPWRDKP